MMKYFSITWFMLLILSVNAQQIDHQNYINTERKHLMQRFDFKASVETGYYDIVYHRAEWEVSPDQYYIKGAITSYFKSKTDGLSQVVFDISSNLTVDSVKQRGSKLNFTFINKMITISLSNLLSNGILDSVTIYYQGEPADNGFGSFATGFTGSSPVLWTLSEPYGAMDWWPCKQSLSDKIDSMDIYVKSGKSYMVGSNGKLMSEVISGDFKTTHWKTRYPIATYLVAIAVAEYTVLRDTALVDENHLVEILNYAYPGSVTDAQLTSDYTVQAVELFSNLFIPYPFYKEKYGHAQFGWGGGMEHQTMTFLCCFYDMLITHELAHQWFGDYVTCGSWKDIWINEGFATYCEVLALEHFNPESVTSWKEDELSSILSATNGSVYVDDTTSVDRIFSGRLSYAKGGYVLEMLRNEIGDEAFFKGCRLLLNRSQEKGGFASTAQLQNYFEIAADTNLTDFFNNWIYGEGYPIYDIISQIESDGSVKIQINQSTSNTSVSFYAMHLELLLTGELTDTIVRVHHIQNGQIFIFKPGFKVLSVQFDPNLHLVAKATVKEGVVTIPENSQDGLIFYPNPTNATLKIKNNTNQNIIRIEIYNTDGKQILQQKIVNQKEVYFNLSNFVNGNYIAKVILTHSSVTNKFTIAK